MQYTLEKKEKKEVIKLKWPIQLLSLWTYSMNTKFQSQNVKYTYEHTYQNKANNLHHVTILIIRNFHYILKYRNWKIGDILYLKAIVKQQMVLLPKIKTMTIWTQFTKLFNTRVITPILQFVQTVCRRMSEPMPLPLIIKGDFFSLAIEIHLSFFFFHKSIIPKVFE